MQGSKFIKERDEDHEHLIVFIHGLTGDQQTFFNRQEQKYFHEYLSLKILENCDIAYYLYPSTKNILKYFITLLAKIPIQNFYFTKKYNQNLEVIIEDLNNVLEHEYHKYKSVSFIGHSMGGIIAKGAIVKRIASIENINFYITLATPHNGGKFAKLGSYFNNHVAALRSDSLLLKELNHKFEICKHKINTHYYRAIFDKYVAKDSAHPSTHDIKPTSIECNHKEIAKPINNYELGELILHINDRIETFLNIKRKNFISYSPTSFFEYSGYLVQDAFLQRDHMYILMTRYDNTDIVIVKVDSSLELDKNFANSGIFTIAIPDEKGKINNNFHKIVMTSSNKILIIGEVVTNDKFKICCIQIDQDGKLDQTYCENGYKIFNNEIEDHEYAMGALLTNDNKLLIAGKQFNSSDLYVKHLKTDGNIEDFFHSSESHDDKKQSVWLNCIAEYGDEIVVAGRCDDWHAYVTKIAIDGTQIQQFGLNGEVIIEGFLRVEDIAIQSNGDILIVGVGNEGRIVRLKSDGVLDVNFGDKGILECIFNERTEALNISLLSNDDFIISGHEYDGNSYQNGLVAYYTKDGVLHGESMISFNIHNKTMVNKLLIKDTKLLAVCSYNIGDMNHRVKIAIQQMDMNELIRTS